MTWLSPRRRSGVVLALASSVLAVFAVVTVRATASAAGVPPPGAGSSAASAEAWSPRDGRPAGAIDAVRASGVGRASNAGRASRVVRGTSAAADVYPAFDAASFGGAMRFRSVGPYRGGRVCAVSGVRGRPATFYFGATGGGVWKTDDAGAHWENVSDRDFRTGSVGAIAVAPSDANVIYVGTGESQMRGNVEAGDGVYKSTDAGRIWANVGLRETRHISRVVVDPRDPQVVYVAALGEAWGPSRERGVYRSRDGGRSWQRVLFVDDRTGAADLAMDPRNPRVLFAGMWQAYRAPWSIESGGPASGLYRSTDGGDSWTKLAGGLPTGTVGRIGVAVSGAREGRVWAIVEAREGGLFRSDDGGAEWQRVSAAHALRQRAWYYSWVYADPRNADTVWLPNVELNKSIDGGRTFTMVGRRFGDNHDLWIDPDDPERMILGNDSGARITWNGGRTWSSADNQPTAQIYRVAIDRREPYWLYGAQQDNTTVGIPSAAPGPGIGRGDWHPVGGGECGWVAPDPGDPEVVYAGGYGGQITRYDHRARQGREIVAWPQQIDGQATRDLKYRFNWNAPILVSRHEPHVLYHAAQLLLRSRDGGASWEEISPDLTRNDKGKQGFSGGPIGLEITGVEVYDTIFALAESAFDAATIWAGSDDGLVHVTRDGGKSWADVTPRGLPEWIQVNALEASPLDPGGAYLAATMYKLGDRRPYLLRTGDYGKSWSRIDGGIPEGAFTRVARADPVRRGLLYAGTEKGLYVSLDDGTSWQPFQLNLPVVPITDLAVAGRDLVVATQGRSFWILDDLTPLREWQRAKALREAMLFPPLPAARDDGAALDAEDAARAGLGENAPAGLVVYYWLARAGEKSAAPAVEIEILAGGKVIRRVSSRRVKTETTEAKPGGAAAEVDDAAPAVLEPKAGLNRFVWDLRREEPKLLVPKLIFDDYPPAGVRVAPGTYTVRLRVGAQTVEQEARVLPNPRAAAAAGAASAADLERQEQLLAAIHARLEETHELVRRIRDLEAQLRDRMERVGRDGAGGGGGGAGAGGVAAARAVGGDGGSGAATGAGALEESARRLTTRLDAVAAKLWNPELQADEDSLVYTPRLDFQFAALAGILSEADARPTAAEERRFADLESQLASLRAQLREIWKRDVPAVNSALEAQGLPRLAVPWQ
jgi:photosystem II stability/assembly factor-like uncharacterized protein